MKTEKALTEFGTNPFSLKNIKRFLGKSKLSSLGEIPRGSNNAGKLPTEIRGFLRGRPWSVNLEIPGAQEAGLIQKALGFCRISQFFVKNCQIPQRAEILRT
jgi:hypothetical protein